MGAGLGLLSGGRRRLALCIRGAGAIFKARLMGDELCQSVIFPGHHLDMHKFIFHFNVCIMRCTQV